ncbi:uncharacterized protein LOC123267934 [Cotesia glomerata]|uniref:uncharacterized protein LOC123267934 n=1 Tax=Cotesia glomerata TaxID=32391 RepID=UPI001D01A3DB|nr:uncharacterized protein LOC123267934 [Cotesia glomerata]
MSDLDKQKSSGLPSGVKCRGCSQGVAKEYVQCTGCQAYYHPSCAERAGSLPNGLIQRCCGRRGSSSTEDIRDIIKQEISALRNSFKNDVTLLRNDIKTDVNNDVTSLRNDIKNEVEPVISSVNDLKSQVKQFTEQFQNRICAVEEKLMNNEVRITANAKIITSNVQKIADLHNLVTDIHTQADNSVILREVDDRLARRNNALFLGIVESQKSTPIERQEDDLSRVQGICYTLANNVSISSCTRLDHNRIDKSKESQGLSPVSGESFDSPRQNKSPEERTKDITSTTPGTDSSRGTKFEDCATDVRSSGGRVEVC